MIIEQVGAWSTFVLALIAVVTLAFQTRRARVERRQQQAQQRRRDLTRVYEQVDSSVLAWIGELEGWHLFGSLSLNFGYRKRVQEIRHAVNLLQMHEAPKVVEGTLEATANAYEQVVRRHAPTHAWQRLEVLLGRRAPTREELIMLERVHARFLAAAREHLADLVEDGQWPSLLTRRVHRR